jgi:hypothetical protein
MTNSLLLSLTQPVVVFLQTAVYVAVTAGFTVILAPVCPSDQLTVPVQPVASNCVLSPAHKAGVLVLKTGAGGNATTRTMAVLLASLSQPSADTQVATYLVSTVGLVTSGLPLVLVVPSFQTTVPVQPEAVSVTDDPKHTSEALGAMTGGAGFLLTVKFTTLLILLSQPVGNKQVAE